MFRCSRKFSAAATQQKPFENSQQQGVQMVGSELDRTRRKRGEKKKGRLGLLFSRYSIPSFFFFFFFFARVLLSEHLEQANICQRKISLRLAILLVAMLDANSNKIINHASRDGRRSATNINSSSYNCSTKNSALKQGLSNMGIH